MSAVIQFYGHSDDIVEVFADSDHLVPTETAIMRKAEGHKTAWEDEFPLEEGNQLSFVLAAPNEESLRLVAAYTIWGTWCFAPTLYEEGYALPEWNYSYRYDESFANGYSPILTFVVPEGTTLTVEEGN